MTEQVFDWMAGGSQRERLEMARALEASATVNDLPQLRQALQVEKVPWIRSALETAVARSRSTGERTRPDPAPLATDDAFAAEVHARATEELSDRFVHELRPALGRARQWAGKEIENYDSSQTKKALTEMQDTLRAFDTLGRAAAPAQVGEFDLASWLRELAASCTDELDHEGHAIEVALDGPPEMVVSTDADLLALAVRNGLRNAIEASDDASAPIVITWGQSKDTVWIAILDDGCGLSLDESEAIGVGTSTKVDHLGMGLTIARQAIASVAGTLALEPTEDGLTRFEVSFPRRGES